jgi:hypothetical protein
MEELLKELHEVRLNADVGAMRKPSDTFVLLSASSTRHRGGRCRKLYGYASRRRGARS